MDLIGLIPSFGNLAFTLAVFVLALSVIVAVHEYGHYIVGRWSGIHAEVFSLGFGPVVWSRMDRRGTKWQVAALPFGGFVKFLGDADAASGKDGALMSRLSPAERRRTVHGAPLWARSATVAAGPVFNFVLSILIFTGWFLLNGVATEAPVVGQMKATPFAGESLRPGDRVLALNGVDTPDLAALVAASTAMAPGDVAEYRVDRSGQVMTFAGPHPFPPLADGVGPQSAAQAAGMQRGDLVTAVDGQPIQTFQQLRDIVGNSVGRELRLTLWRGGETVEIALTPRRMDLPLPEGGFETRWLIGLSGGLVFEPQTRVPGVFEGIGLGISETWRIATTSLSGLWHMITGAISTCNLQGPVGIAESSGAAASQGTVSFILFVAMLSTAVGLLNLFPVPVLDGGHLVFHAWEAVTGRPPSDRALRVLMGAGLTLLLSLMLFALGNDLFCP
ncbi:MAG: RIP metalloprotease RseP [Paracoccaceae bacterium]|nr:MAG: RIP metalloprotease RseP [Paracoccaceae bacterium]